MLTVTHVALQCIVPMDITKWPSLSISVTLDFGAMVVQMMRAMMILKGRAQCCKDIDDGGYGSCFHTLSLYSASSVSLTLTLSTVDITLTLTTV